VRVLALLFLAQPWTYVTFLARVTPPLASVPTLLHLMAPPVTMETNAQMIIARQVCVLVLLLFAQPRTNVTFLACVIPKLASVPILLHLMVPPVTMEINVPQMISARQVCVLALLLFAQPRTNVTFLARVIPPLASVPTLPHLMVLLVMITTNVLSQKLVRAVLVLEVMTFVANQVTNVARV